MGVAAIRRRLRLSTLLGTPDALSESKGARRESARSAFSPASATTRPLFTSVAHRRPALRLDAAEKRASRVFVLVSSAWVPVTHASVAPFHRVFQTDAVASLAVGRAVDVPRK